MLLSFLKPASNPAEALSFRRNGINRSFSWVFVRSASGKFYYTLSPLASSVFQPAFQIGLNEGIIVEFRIEPVDPVDGLGLPGAEVLTRIETPAAFQQPLPP